MLAKVADAAASTRTAGVAAIGFALLIVAANLVVVPAGMPSPGAPASEAIEFFTTADQPTGTIAVFLPAAWILASVFAGGAVAAVLRASTRAPAGAAYAGFAGVLLQNAVFTVVVALRLAMSALDDPDQLRTLWAVHEALFGFNGTFLALAMLGLGTAGYGAGILGRWRFLLGILGAALQFASASLTSLIATGHDRLSVLGLLGWLLWVVWLIGYGVALIRRSEPARGDAPDPGTPRKRESAHPA
ncbi:2-oxoglutarate/malate transporter [Nocardia sp. NPDC024068]|uniref:2-oxoglutarate/malate transporter n=1 Tax=Nocardia sp. NPDC024068 TaxID=3157197 RepID=UPI0033E97168